nr:hypothetical protein [Tolypothrix sp. FACHB-123]
MPTPTAAILGRAMWCLAVAVASVVASTYRALMATTASPLTASTQVTDQAGQSAARGTSTATALMT